MSDWALAFNPDGTSGGDNVTFPTSISNNVGTALWSAEFSIKLTAGYPATGNWYLVGSSSSTVQGIALRQASGDGAIGIVVANTFRFASQSGFVLDDGLFHTYRIEHDADGSTRFYRDGVQIGPSVSFTTSVSWSLNRFGAGSTTATVFTPFEMKYFTYSGASGGRTWRSDLSGGIGTSLPTDETTNNGTLNGFGASPWINYDLGVSFSSVSESISESASQFFAPFKFSSISESISESISDFDVGTLPVSVVFGSASRSTSRSTSLFSFAINFYSNAASSSLTISNFSIAGILPVFFGSISISTSKTISKLQPEDVFSLRYLERFDGLNFDGHRLYRYDSEKFNLNKLRRWDGKKWVPYNA